MPKILILESKWRSWFSWRPVKINGKWTWLQPLERQHVTIILPCGYSCIWYRKYRKPDAKTLDI